MGITTIIALIVLAILFLAVYEVIIGIKKKEWKRITISIVGAVLVIAGIYWALISFITSM